MIMIEPLTVLIGRERPLPAYAQELLRITFDFTGLFSLVWADFRRHTLQSHRVN